MKSLLAALALTTVLAASPVLAQSATQAITDAATNAASKATTDTVNKTLGTESQSGGKDKKAKKGPNYGNSEDHRMDGEKKRPGKDKKKN